MVERPILFSAPMVRALLDGTKTQTRRIVKLPKSLKDGDLSTAFADKAYGITPCLHVPMPDGSVQRLRNPWGWLESELMQLWVRETFVIENNLECGSDAKPTFNDGRPINWGEGDYEWLWRQPHYKATDPTPELYYEDNDEPFCRWKPSIFMPRWASRIQLEITNIRVERLQNISESDALKEGAKPDYADAKKSYWFDTATECYEWIWESINGAGSWSKNPWVWVVEFKRVQP